MSAAVTRGAARLLVALAALAAPAAAQDGADDGSAVDWRPEVERLTSRWADDAGTRRLERARDLLRARTTTAADDADAWLELARCELAAGQAQAALTAADRAATLWAEDEARDKARRAEADAQRARDGQPPLDPPGRELVERRAVAQAVAYLAATRAALADARQRPDEARARAALDERQAQIERRRRALFEAAGEGRAPALVRAETARVASLRVLDLLGQAPRPLGGDAQPVDFTAFRGKVVLVLFWSRSPIDCADTLLACDAVYQALHARGLEALGVCVDAPDGAAPALVAEKGVAWRQVYVGQGLLARDARAWGVDHLPAGVLIDAGGRVRYIDPWEGDLRLACEELLDRRDAAAEGKGGW